MKKAQEVTKVKRKTKTKKGDWGPILPEKRSKRNSQDGASMLFLSFTSAYKKASKVSPGVTSYK